MINYKKNHIDINLNNINNFISHHFGLVEEHQLTFVNFIITQFMTLWLPLLSK